MKKTLITLLALAGVALGETVVFDFGRTDSEAYKTSGAITIGTGSAAYQGAINASGELGTITGNYSYVQQASSGNFNNSATLDRFAENPTQNWKEHLNVLPSGWESTFSDGLTSQWSGSTGNTHTLTLSNLAAGYYDVSILGGYHGKDTITSSITLSIGGEKFDTSSTVWSSHDIAGGTTPATQGKASYTLNLTNGSADEGYTFDVSRIYVREGGSLSFTLTGSETAGQRTPLNGIKVSYTTPEPTTATLSLLALAGLAARRRRK